MVVYDTYAWIEYFRGSRKGERVRALLRRGGFTPSIVLAEIARKYMREGYAVDEVRKRLLFIETRTRIVPIDTELSLRAAKTYLELYEYAKKNRLRTPSLADAVVYAAALTLGEELVTGDRLFKDLPNVIYIGD
ncbi:MAG: type II toxin-antitoxin system VapC family toxin [Thermoprotei archaeon]|nr:MAG: type II toxin-antitoxin system VapC family toxin [Thermoprotei archaeon]